MAEQSSQRLTFADALSRYRGKDRFLGPLEEFFGNTPLTEITQEAIDRGASICYPDAAVSTVIRQYYVPLAAVLHCAAAAGLCEYRQVTRPRLPIHVRLRYISPAESIRLAAECWPHFRPLYVFMQHTGALPSEAVFLQSRQIDLNRRTVRFPKSKAANGRIIPLHPRVIDALEPLQHGEGPVFRRMDRKPYKDKPGRAAAAVKTAFTKACDRAGILDFTLRDVRTTWAVWQLARNRDFDVLEWLGGWRDRRALDRFKTLSAADLDAATNALRDLDQAAFRVGRGDSLAVRADLLAR